MAPAELGSSPATAKCLITRKFDAPAELLFDVLTKPEHVSVWFT